LGGLRGGREDAKKASKFHEKTSEDPATFALAPTRKIFRVSGVLFSISDEVLFTFSEQSSLPRPNRDQKADGGEGAARAARSDRLASLPPRSLPPSLPLAVAAPLPELPAADAARAPPPKLCTRFFSLSNRASRRRRIIATAKGGTGTDGGEGGTGPRPAGRSPEAEGSSE